MTIIQEDQKKRSGSYEFKSPIQHGMWYTIT